MIGAANGTGGGAGGGDDGQSTTALQTPDTARVSKDVSQAPCAAKGGSESSHQNSCQICCVHSQVNGNIASSRKEGTCAKRGSSGPSIRLVRLGNRDADRRLSELGGAGAMRPDGQAIEAFSGTHAATPSQAAPASSAHLSPRRPTTAVSDFQRRCSIFRCRRFTALPERREGLLHPPALWDW